MESRCPSHTCKAKTDRQNFKDHGQDFFFFSIYIKLHCDFHFTPFGLYSNTIFAALLFNTSVDLKELGYRVCGVKRG